MITSSPSKNDTKNLLMQTPASGRRSFLQNSSVIAAHNMSGLSNTTINNNNNNNNNNNTNNYSSKWNQQQLASPGGNLNSNNAALSAQPATPAASNNNNNNNTTTNNNNNNNNNTSVVQGNQQAGQLREVRILPDLVLSQSDFEKKFTKSPNEKCLNKCDFYETWKYTDMNGEPFIVKKYLRLDDQKWKKLVNSYNLQFHLATVSSFFIKPYRLVSFSVMVAPNSNSNMIPSNSSNSQAQRNSFLSHSQQSLHHNQSQQQQQLQSQQQQQQQQQQPQMMLRRQQLFVIYQYQQECMSIQSFFSNNTIELSDLNILNLTVQLFRIGQECAAKNFPLINWKFSNLFVAIKSLKSQLSSQNQQPLKSIVSSTHSTHQAQQQLPATLTLKSARQSEQQNNNNNNTNQQNPQTTTTTTTTTAPPRKIVDSSLQIMDLYDYFGIENRDGIDPLLPPELRQDLRQILPGATTNGFEDYQGNLEQSSVFMTGMILALLLRMKYPQFISKDPTLLSNSTSATAVSASASAAATSTSTTLNTSNTQLKPSLSPLTTSNGLTVPIPHLQSSNNGTLSPTALPQYGLNAALRRRTSVSFLPTPDEIARRSIQLEAAAKKNSILNTTTNSSLPVQFQNASGETSVASMNAFMESLITGTAQKNPLINALAMIIKVTISANPSERPTFSSSLDVVRDVFGEIIDTAVHESAPQTGMRTPTATNISANKNTINNINNTMLLLPKYTNSEKRLISQLEFTNTLIEQNDFESASIELSKAKKTLVHKANKRPLPHTLCRHSFTFHITFIQYFYQIMNGLNSFVFVESLDFLTTGNMLFLQGRISISMTQYNEALKTIKLLEKYPEEHDEIYHLIYPQILRQIGICCFKLSFYEKALPHIREAVTLLQQQEKLMRFNTKNSLRFKVTKALSTTLMWRAMIERIIFCNQFAAAAATTIVSPSATSKEATPPFIASINEALSYTPKNSREYIKIMLVKARLVSSRGQTEKALKYISKQQENLIQLNPNHSQDLLSMECFFVRGLVYFQKDCISESIRQFNLAYKVFEARGLSHHPSCGEIFSKLAKCYSRQGKISQASSLFERALLLKERASTSERDTSCLILNAYPINIVEAETRFNHLQTEEPESLLMYNYCMYLKDQGQHKQSKQLSLELYQNNKIAISPTPTLVNALLDQHYSSLLPKIIINKPS